MANAPLDVILEEVPRMTYKESIKYFLGVTNGDFYNSKADNIFELTKWGAI